MGRFDAAIFSVEESYLMRSIAIPSLSHHMESLDRPNKALPEAKGAPLSVRMAEGRPGT